MEAARAVVRLPTNGDRRCARGGHLGPVRLRHDRLHGAPLEAWICERCGKDITDE